MARLPFRLEVAIHLAILCWAVLGIGVSVLPGIAEPSSAVPSQGTEAAMTDAQQLSLGDRQAAGGGLENVSAAASETGVVPATSGSSAARPALLFASGFMIMALAIALRYRLSWLLPVRKMAEV